MSLVLEDKLHSVIYVCPETGKRYVRVVGIGLQGATGPAGPPGQGAGITTEFLLETDGSLVYDDNGNPLVEEI